MSNPAITVLVDPDSGGIVVTGDTPEYRRTLDLNITDSDIASAAACRVRLLYRNTSVCVGEEWTLNEYGDELTGSLDLNTSQLGDAFAGRSARAVIPLTMEIIDVTTNAVVASGQVSCKNNPVVAGTVVIVQEHAEQHAAGADDAITPAAIGAQAEMATASAAEMIAGTAEGLRAMSPSLVSSAIAAQASPLSHATASDNPHSVTPAQIGAATAAQGLLAETALQDATAFEPAGAVSSHDGDAGAHADQIAAAIAAAGLGTGNVTGPASSTDGGLVAFSGLTGKVLKAGPAIGTTAGTIAAGDDARFTDARTPTAHASTHASGAADPVTLAAIEPTIDAAVPATAGAGNMLVTEADLAGLGGGGGLEVVHVVAATLTPESGKHYVCANDVQIIAPETPTGSLLWECSIYLEPGVILSYPTGWLVSGYADSSAANRARISYANGSAWHIDWEAKYETVSGDVIYVSTAGDDTTNDGRSWASAYRTAHKAFAVAESGQQIWIAAGDYDAGIANGYSLPSGVTVYGGFAGTEGSTAERSRTPDGDGIGASAYAHETVLSNRVDVTPEAAWVCFANQPAGAGNPCTLNGLTVGPSRQGVYCVQAGAAVLVDCLVTGCVYAGATADGGGLTNATATACTIQNCSAGRNGGGAYQGTLTNCVLSGNSAGNGGGASGGTLTNCVLSGNSAGTGGGAYQGTLTNCVLSGNSAGANGGGANGGTLTNCVLSGNSAGANGGGAHSATLINCVLSGNSASNGGGAYQGTLTNCVLSGNSASNGGGAHSATLINCLVLHNYQSGVGTALLTNVTQRNCLLWRNIGTVSGTATNTIDDASLALANFADPLDIPAGAPPDLAALLAAIQAGGYDVAAGSPVINAGTDSYNTTAYDLLGRPRKVGTIDIGPYEYQGA